MLIEDHLLDEVTERAKGSERLRMNYNLHDSLEAKYNTAVNSDHRVSLTKTIKFTHYVNNKKEAQCRFQGPSGYRGNQRTGDPKRTGQAV